MRPVDGAHGIIVAANRCAGQRQSSTKYRSAHDDGATFPPVAPYRVAYYAYLLERGRTVRSRAGELVHLPASAKMACLTLPLRHEIVKVMIPSLRRIVIGLFLIVLVALSSTAFGAEIRVFCTFGFQGAITQLAPQFERETGNKLI